MTFQSSWLPQKSISSLKWVCILTYSAFSLLPAWPERIFWHGDHDRDAEYKRLGLWLRFGVLIRKWTWSRLSWRSLWLQRASSSMMKSNLWLLSFPFLRWGISLWSSHIGTLECLQVQEELWIEIRGTVYIAQWIHSFRFLWHSPACGYALPPACLRSGAACRHHWRWIPLDWSASLVLCILCILDLIL